MDGAALTWRNNKSIQKATRAILKQPHL